MTSRGWLQAKSFDYSDAVVAGERIEAMDFDPLTSIIYWTDSSRRSVLRALAPQDEYTTGHPQDLNIDVTLPTGIAFDYVTKVMFWTDRARGEINCATDDGRYKRTIVSGSRFQPSAIVVQPKLGLVFWTDTYAYSPKIEVAWMNGYNRTVLVHERLANPTGLAIDTRMRNRLYWSDSKENIIESMNVDGSDRVIVASGRLLHPYSLDVFSGDLYWVSLMSGTVMRMDKFGRGVNQTVQAGLLMPKAVKAFHRLRYDVNIKNRCESLRCNPLCVHVPGGATCMCPNDSDFLPGSTRACDMSIEKAKPQLQTCKCVPGTCVQSPQPSGQLLCSCDKGYHGDQCQYGASTYHHESRRAMSVAIPICVLLVIVFIVVAIWYRWKRNGYVLQ